MGQRKKGTGYILREKEKKNQSSATITIYVDGKGTVFRVNSLNKDIKKKI